MKFNSRWVAEGESPRPCSGHAVLAFDLGAHLVTTTLHYINEGVEDCIGLCLLQKTKFLILMTYMILGRYFRQMAEHWLLLIFALLWEP